MQGRSENMSEGLSALSWLIIIIFGVPFFLMFVIPILIWIGIKLRIAPDMMFLIKYFKIDPSRPPYSEWMEKSPALFISMTAIELYVSWYLIKIIRGIKWIGKGLWWLGKNTIGRYVKYQWKKWDKDFEEQDKGEKNKARYKS
jgi:hypothetical protein